MGRNEQCFPPNTLVLVQAVETRLLQLLGNDMQPNYKFKAK